MTVLVQDQSGGLQVLHEDQWVDVPPSSGAWIVKLGDMTQVSKFICSFMFRFFQFLSGGGKSIRWCYYT